MRNAYISVGKHKEKCPLGRPRHRWEANIKIDVKGMWCEGVDWIQLAPVAGFVDEVIRWRTY